MIKTNLEQIVDTYDNFKGLINVTLPTKVSYWVNRIFNKIVPIVEEFKEKQNELIREYGDAILDENKKISKYEVKEGEKKEKYLEKIEELVKAEIEIPFDTIPIRALEKQPIAPRFLIDYVFTEDSDHPAFKKGIKED